MATIKGFATFYFCSNSFIFNSYVYSTSSLRSQMGLSEIKQYGVMVAQEFLVLFV